MFVFAKRSISKVVASSLLLSTFVPAVAFGATVPFKDTADSYAAQEINLLAESGIVSGYENNRFQPMKAMTRAELAKMIVLSMGLKENPDQAAAYQDVRPDSWYRGYVGALVEAGITAGTSGTTFSPEAQVTREELVVFFIRGLGLETAAKQLSAETSLTDFAGVSDWAKPHVALAHRIGFVSGIDNGDGTLKFNPKAAAERQALARLAYEFKVNKAAYVDAANALALAAGNSPAKPEAAEDAAVETLEITGVSEVNSTTVEVVFASAVRTVSPADFTFDNGLAVTGAELKNGSSTIVVLTTSGQAPGTTYNLSYKGKETGQSVLSGSTSSGTNSRRKHDNNSVTVEEVKQQLASGVAQGTVTIKESGTYGAENGPDTPVEHLIVDPGPTGEVTLRHILPDELEVLSGDVNSIKLQQTVIKQLRVNAVNNGGRDVRIETKDGTTVNSVEIESQAVLESSSSTGKLGTIKLTSAAAGKSLTLKGNIDGEVNVDAPGSTVKLDPPSGGNSLPTIIKNLKISKSATVQTDQGATVQTLGVSGSGTSLQLNGSGQVNTVAVDSSASGTVLTFGADANVRNVRADSNVTLAGEPKSIAKLKTEGSAGIQLEASIASKVKSEAIRNAVTAIDAIGSVDSYSSELESQIDRARQAVGIATSLGVQELEISNLGDYAAKSEAIQTLKDLISAQNSLEVGFIDGDSAASVTGNLVLKSSGDKGSAIQWTSDNLSVVAEDGRVTRPAAGQPDAEVTLTAFIKKNGYSLSKMFKVVVKAAQKPAAPTVTGVTYEPAVTVTGATYQLELKATFSDNSTPADVTVDAVWTSQDTSIVTVTPDGVLQGLSDGVTTVTAQYKGFTATYKVSVVGFSKLNYTLSGTVWTSLTKEIISGNYSSPIRGDDSQGDYEFTIDADDQNHYLIVQFNGQFDDDAYQSAKVFGVSGAQAVDIYGNSFLIFYHDDLAPGTYDVTVSGLKKTTNNVVETVSPVRFKIKKL